MYMGTQRGVREGTNSDELLVDEGFNAFLGGIIQKKFGLDRFAARREEACGRSDVDVRDEQPLFTVWLVAEQRPVGPHHRRSGRRPSACKVYSCEIAGVIRGATQGCFLME